MGATPLTGTSAPAALLQRYLQVRGESLAATQTLSAEDQCVQSMPDASPTKWHLAHTTWFFEAMVLQPHAPGYVAHDARFAALFNSYYESLGPRHPRPQRGLLTRPTLAQVHAYRQAVDAAIAALIESLDAERLPLLGALIETGLQHEQQHQELILTDILHAMSLNPLRPAVRGTVPPLHAAGADTWHEHAGGPHQAGHAGPGFAFDNEGPRHTCWLEPFAMASRLVTNAQYQAFIDAGGYRQAGWWLSDGWAMVQAQGWQAPLYWLDDKQEGGLEFTLHGVQPRRPDQAVRHLSFYEAAAFAEWAGARLPTEFEWEVAMAAQPPSSQAFGVAWQWTASAYAPYPRYRPPAGPLGEYNAKFMVGQQVLRGSSTATPAGHARLTYRNFFPPGTRWQFAGLRLARDL